MTPADDLPVRPDTRADLSDLDRSGAISRPSDLEPQSLPFPSQQKQKTNYVLVDLENVQPHIAFPDGRLVKLKIFVGPNQGKVPLDMVLAIQAYGTNAEYIQTDGQADNALDFYITYYIGEIVGSLGGQIGDVCFHIISKDRGFDPLIKHLKAKGIFCRRSTSFASIPFDGINQVQPNPWEKVAERYPPGMQIEGVVGKLVKYGAFVEIEKGIDALLHVSEMSWLRKVADPSEVLQTGEKVKCVILSVDQERKRVALSLKQLANDPWKDEIPACYHPGDIKKGKVAKLTNFGVFVELEQGLQGLLHISELADQKIESPADVVKVGDEIEVKVLLVDAAERKIGLSRKRLNELNVPEIAVATPESGQTMPEEQPAGEEHKAAAPKVENADKVQAIIKNLAKQRGKPSTLKALHGTIKTLFANRITDEEVQHLANQLVVRGELTVSQNRVCYSSNPVPNKAQVDQKKSPPQKRDVISPLELLVRKLKPQKNKPNTVKALCSTINSYYGMKLTEAEIANLIGQLKQRGFIKVSQNKVKYQLPS